MSNPKRLSPSEIRRIKDFIFKYQDLNQELLKMETDLEKIEENKSGLLENLKSLGEEINKIREDEDNFRSALLTKYGKFNLNLETFEITQS